jgi:hypothetical protein
LLYNIAGVQPVSSLNFAVIETVCCHNA